MKLVLGAILLVALIVLIVMVIRSSPPPKKVVEQPRHMKANTAATFDRPSNEDDFRPKVNNIQNYANISLPANWSAFSQWPGTISGVYDQEACGSCWAFSTSNAFSDRLKIKYGEKHLQGGDYISPFNLAACVKCGGVNGACPRVCEGNYLDDVCQFLADHGAIPQSIIDQYSEHGLDYACLDTQQFGFSPIKAKHKYRVNVYPPSMLNNAKNLEENEKAIMHEIYQNGTVSCIVKVFTPNDSRNFYMYKKGVYGHGWKTIPNEMEGYHAITILGWGEEIIDGETVKYWIVRNSWGPEWGTGGLGKIVKGENFAYIESDIWALEV